MSVGKTRANEQLFDLLSSLVNEVESMTNEEEVDLRAKIEALRTEVTKVPSQSSRQLDEMEIAGELDRLSSKLEEVDEAIACTVTTEPEVKSLLSSTADIWMPVITATSEDRREFVASVQDGEANKEEDYSTLNRYSFPQGFVFGASSSAYQYEGGWNEDGKTPSIWDTFTMQYPEKIADHSNAKIAEDFYHRYKEDVKGIKEIGLDAFRFSISWSRLLPHGKVVKGVNPFGIQLYNNLINELLANGITPYAVLFHWDLPQVLENEYGGFLSPKIVDDFREYAEVCFGLFGDRVKHWITMNEPNIYSIYGYANGMTAPGRCSSYVGNCSAGNSATEPYLVTHHLLLSHASAFNLYRHNYQPHQRGQVGIVLDAEWIVPLDDSSRNRDAATRRFDFRSGWILDPINLGDYPESMRLLVGNRLPEFSKEEASLLKGSFHFIGLNYYTSFYAQDDNSTQPADQLSYTTDSHTTLSYYKDGVPIGQETALSWLHIYPQGLGNLLSYVKEKYSNPPVIITENGMADWNNDTLPVEKAVQDYLRIRYYYLHLSYLDKQISKGSDVRGYFLWSFLDDFEWYNGYTIRFGIHYIDYKHGLTRHPKYSALWFHNFLQKQLPSSTFTHQLTDVSST